MVLKRGEIKRMSEEPLVSIIIAAHNEERNIKRAIYSAINQTYRNLEIIVVDDASTDNTFQIARRISEKDERILVLRNPRNLGPAYSRNIGLKYASGKYVGILDADDWYHLRKISSQVSFLEKKESYGIVGTFCILLCPGGGLMKIQLPVTHEEILKTMVYRNPFVHSSVLIRKNILDEVGYYDVRYRRAHDYELYFRILSKCKGANIPKYLCYRMEKVKSKKTMIESTLNSIIIPLRYYKILKKNVIYYPLLLRRLIVAVGLLVRKSKEPEKVLLST